MDKRDDNLFNERLKRKNLHAINNSEFGDNVVILNGEDDKNLSRLLAKRNSLLREREKVLKILLPLMDEEHKLTAQLNEINMQMCEIQGHRLEDKPIRTKQYGDVYRCLVCHKLVSLADLRPRDTFATKEDNKKVRILYKK